MTRTICTLLALTVAFLPACGVEELEAIIAMYDTFGSTGSSSTGAGSSTVGASSGLESGDSSTTGGGSTHEDGGSGSASASTGGEATTSEGTTTVGATTGGGAVCGDGEREGEEECDDANEVEGDGCLSNCTKEWYVFVTSKPSTQGDLKGLVGADYECRHRATKMFLPNGERYMAWISTSEVQPVDRLYHARGPYKLLNGLRVAASWDALIAGPLENFINVNELSETREAVVFTGTTATGERVADSTHCDDWTDNDGDNFGWVGVTEAVDGDWTLAFQGNCDGGAAVYCFEQP